MATHDNKHHGLLEVSSLTENSSRQYKLFGIKS